MTREEAKEYVFLNNIHPAIKAEVDVIVDALWISSGSVVKFVDTLYDDIESKICENCKHYDYLSRANGKTSRAMPYYVCRSDFLEADGGWFEPYDENFGCNKFERKVESK